MIGIFTKTKIRVKHKIKIRCWKLSKWVKESHVAK